MALGKRLKELLKDRGITILEFATITGISKNTLYGITKRDSDNITFENLQKIADALDMTVDELQQAILAKMAGNGLVTDQMKKTVYDNIWHDSLVNWLKSFH